MYRFKLEALLTHRRHQEETGQKELAQARRKLSEEREKLDRKKREKQESLKDLQAKKKRTTISDILLIMNFIQQLSKDIEDQSMRAHKTAKIVDQKRRELVSIMQKHKSLKKLKYKEQQAYQEKLMQNERKSMDELASIRHARKM